MDSLPILKVAVLDDNRIAVFPKTKRADFQYVYREAAGVSWDDASGCFVSSHLRSWSSQMWFEHILSTVESGLGLQMVLTDNTEGVEFLRQRS